MATLSQYIFFASPGFWGGPFEIINAAVPDNPLQAVGLTNVVEAQNLSVWRSFRPSSEVSIEIASKVNVPAITAQIDALATEGSNAGFPTQVTSAILVQIVPWVLVPYWSQRPKSHADLAMLIRLYFTLHIKTPWPASDADVTVSFYVLPALVKGRLVAVVDGAWVQVDGGWPVSQKIADLAGAGALKVLPGLQTTINGNLSAVSKAQFSKLYLLPGKGNKTAGTWFDDADLDAVLALVP